MSFPDRTNRPTAVFSIQAAADPGALPRIFGLFAKHGLVPSRWVGSLHENDARVHVTLECDGLTDADVRRLANGLRQMLCIEAVVTDWRSLAMQSA